MEIKSNSKINGTKIDNSVIYFLQNDKIVLSSSLSRRILARILDFIFSSLLGTMIFTIYYFTKIETATTNNVIESIADNLYGEIRYFDNFSHEIYSVLFITSIVLQIIGTIFFNIIFPIINKNNVGQSLGKKIMKIGMVFDNENKKISTIIKRESLISLLQVIMLSSILISGTNISFLHMQYKQWYDSVLFNLKDGNYEEIFIKEFDNYNSIWSFIIYTSSNKNIMGNLQLNTLQRAFSFIKEMVQITFSLSIVVLLISIMFGVNKRGIHDNLSKTSIVDLRTLQSKNNFDKIMDLNNDENVVEKKYNEIDNEIPIELNIKDEIK